MTVWGQYQARFTLFFYGLFGYDLPVIAEATFVSEQQGLGNLGASANPKP